MEPCVCLYGASSGASTLFNILCGLKYSPEDFYKDEKNIEIIEVPDERLDFLREFYKPKKFTPAKIKIIDARAAGFNDLYQADLIVAVIGEFLNKGEFKNEIQKIIQDFLIDDLTKIENRIERLSKKNKTMTNSEKIEYELLKKMNGKVNEGVLLSDIILSDDEEKLFRGFRFLTRKKIIFLINTDEENINLMYNYEGYNLFSMCLKLEEELASLSEDEREEFLSNFNLKQSAKNVFINTVFKTLDLISFFTVGEDEVRAWPVLKGTSAYAAAGEIYSDIQRGFIKAEVISFDKFKEYNQDFDSLVKAKKTAMYGKDYTAADGDIIHFKFNV